MCSEDIQTIQSDSDICSKATVHMSYDEKAKDFLFYIFGLWNFKGANAYF